MTVLIYYSEGVHSQAPIPFMVAIKISQTFGMPVLAKLCLAVGERMPKVDDSVDQKCPLC